MYDVAIIGAGVTGCAVARYLSRYQLRICVIEKEADVCCGTSKANSAIIHAGFDAAHGSLMAHFNVEGSKMMPELAEALDIPFTRNGSLVVCLSEDDRPKLEKLYENGVKNGVEQLRIIEAEELRAMEPHISPNAVAALWAPTGGIVCPFLMTIALAENAAENGVEFLLNTPVQCLQRSEDGSWQIDTGSKTISARCVVNAAGVYADVLNNMVSEKKIHITPRRGQYLLLDHAAGGHVSHTIFQLPGVLGKGVLVSPTIHGNLLVGPTAEDIDDRNGVNTTAEGIADLIAKSSSAVSDIPLRQVITSFSGLRAHEDHHEFVLGEAEDAPGFFNCAGIESPGLSSAPAIGLYISDMVAEKLNAQPDPQFKGTHKGILHPSEMTKEEYNALIAREPAYGNIICRCETVTEGEIIDAIRRPVGATTLDGIKRRVRAGMGRCQSGFCSPRVMEILARELCIPMSEITKNGAGCGYITGTNKDSIEGGDPA